MFSTTRDGLTSADGYDALDWLARVCTPAWLDAAGLVDEAARLRNLPPLLDMDAIRVAAGPLRELQTVAYRRARVLVWAQIEACNRPFGAMGAKNAASAITGFSQLNPDSRVVALVAGYAWTVAAYAAHVVSDAEREWVAAKLAVSLPVRVEG